MKKIIVVHNQKYGPSSKLDQIQEAFKAANITPTYIELNTQTTSRLKKEKLTKQTIVVAAGGDGTVNAVVNMVKDSATIGVLAVGTLNHFAKDSDIPLDINEAVAAIKMGTTKKIDAVLAADRLFVNNASIGVYPYFVRQRDRYAKTIFKWPAAFVALMYTLIKLPSKKVTLELEDHSLSGNYSVIFAGNNSYGIHATGFTNRKKLDGGTICLYVLKQTTRVGLLTGTVKVLLGNTKALKELHTTLLTKFSVHSKRPIWISYDGEVEKLSENVTFVMKPRYLTVITPSS